MQSISPLTSNVTAQPPIQVSQVFQRLNWLLARHSWAGHVCVIGEVSLDKTTSAKHMYFHLKDENSKISCKFFYYKKSAPGHIPVDGERVVVRGHLETYGGFGDFYINVEKIEQAGWGDLAAQLEKLRLKLQQEHLFDPERKRPLPTFPRVIGVVTSNDGMAIGDITAMFAKRAPHIQVWVVPALVQGKNAPASMIRALKYLESLEAVDAIILGRGGGSAEELMAFNDEHLVRAVASCTKPIVTAIGHKDNHSLCDLASDKEATTPTNSVEIIAPQRDDMLADIQRQRNLALKHMRTRLDLQRKDLDILQRRCQLSSPQARLNQFEQDVGNMRQRLQTIGSSLTTRHHHSLELLKSRRAWQITAERLIQAQQTCDDYRERAEAAITGILSNLATEITHSREKLRVLNPRHALKRGYAMVSDTQGQIITSVSGLQSGQELQLNLGDGRVNVRITEIIPEPNP